MSLESVKPPKKVAVIGAGPAGLAAAHKLTQAGLSVDLYEASSSEGGFCRSLDLWGYKVDLGPHRFFSSSERVHQLWQNVLGDNFLWVRRQTRIFYQKKFFTYPLRPSNIFFNLGGVESVRCFLSYAWQKFFGKKQRLDNFEGWVVAKFGRRLFSTFFKSYTERLWGLPCHLIDSDFAERKIRRISVLSIIKKVFSVQKTHVEYFAYPCWGTGFTYAKLKERVLAHGGNIFFNSPAQSLQRIDEKWHLGSSQGDKVYDFVISSMPITQLIHALKAPEDIIKESEQLQFRNTILVYLLIKGGHHFSDNWVYMHTPGIECGRVTNFRNWSPAMYGDKPDTVLCLEYWCSPGDVIWKSLDKDIVEQAQRELSLSGLVEHLVILESHVCRLAKTYPVFHLGYKKSVATLEAYLAEQPALIAIGRNGSFKYNNQDHSLLMGLKAADQVLSGEKSEISVFDHSYEEDRPILPTKEFDEI